MLCVGDKMSNYYEEMKKCFCKLDKLFKPTAKETQFDLNWLMIDLQKTFSVSEKAIQKKLEQYEKAGIIFIKDEIVFVFPKKT